MRTAQAGELLRFGDLRRGVQMAPIVVGLAAVLAVVAAARLPTPYSYLGILIWVTLLAYAGFRWPAGTLVFAEPVPAGLPGAARILAFAAVVAGAAALARAPGDAEPGRPLGSFRWRVESGRSAERRPGSTVSGSLSSTRTTT